MSVYNCVRCGKISIKTGKCLDCKINFEAIVKKCRSCKCILQNKKFNKCFKCKINYIPDIKPVKIPFGKHTQNILIHF